MRKKLTIVLIFVLLLKAGLWQLSNILSIGQNDVPTVGTYRTFYEEPDNSLQIIALGNSRMLFGWNSLNLWESTGFSSYSLATHSQPAVLIKYLIKEVRKTQEEPLFIIDINCFRTDQLYFLGEETIRRVTDSIPYSMNRREMIDAALDFYHSALDYRIALNADNEDIVTELRESKENISKIDYYWKLLKYHSKWDKLRETDFTGAENPYKSVLNHYSLFKTTPIQTPVVTQKTTTLDDNQTALLEELLTYIEENKINVIFTSLPASLKEEQAMQINQIMSVLKERGHECLNFNTEEMYQQLGLTFETDFFDEDHVNANGSKKLMKYMANYLSKNYAFIDQREESSYRSWNEAMKAYEKFAEMSKQKVESQRSGIQ